MKIALDYDGVISANWNHYSQLAYNFFNSGHDVHVISAANPKRLDEVLHRLRRFPLIYHHIHTRPVDLISSHKNIGEWKKSVLKKWEIDLWFDNEVKIYEQAGVNFSDLKTAIVRI